MTGEIGRRELVLGLGAALAAPLPARARPKRKPVVGALSGIHEVGLSPFEDGLTDAGFDDPDESVAITTRFDGDNYDELPKLAADLVRRRVDVIAAWSLTAGLAARRATKTIPIVT